MEEQQQQPAAQSSSTPWTSMASLLAGPIAGVCSRLCTYPMDTVKARLQVQGAVGGPLTYSSTLDAVVQVARKEGIRGFYRGFAVVAVGNIPANMAYFGGYEMAKSLVPGEAGIARDMAAGAAAQLVGGLMFTPIDIIKERMQVQSIMKGQFSYSGSWHALKSLLQANGVLGLFKGYWATNAVWIPWSIIHISLYEQAKRMAAAALAPQQQQQAGEGSSGSLQGSSSSSRQGAPSTSQAAAGSSAGSSQEQSQAEAGATGSLTGKGQAKGDALPPWVLGLCSAASASTASLLTHPADVIKTRLQVLSAGQGGQQLTALQLARKAIGQEGPKVLVSGALARILTLAPGSALSWMVYEPVRNAIESYACQL